MCFPFLSVHKHRTQLPPITTINQNQKHTQHHKPTIHATILDHYGKPTHPGHPHPILRRTPSGRLFQPHAILPPRLARMKPFASPSTTPLPAFDTLFEDNPTEPKSLKSRLLSSIGKDALQMTNADSLPRLPRRASLRAALSRGRRRSTSAGSSGSELRRGDDGSRVSCQENEALSLELPAPLGTMNGMLVPPSSLRHKNERRRLKLEKRVRFAEAPEYFNEDASPAVTEPDLAEEQDSKAPVSPSEDPGNRPRRLSRGVSFLGSKYLSPENPLLQDDEYLRLLERVGEGDGGETESLGLLEGDVWGEIAVEYD